MEWAIIALWPSERTPSAGLLPWPLRSLKVKTFEKRCPGDRSYLKNIFVFGLVCVILLSGVHAELEKHRGLVDEVRVVARSKTMLLARDVAEQVAVELVVLALEVAAHARVRP